MTKEEITARLVANLQEQINDEEHEFYIDIKSVNMTDFIYALSSMMPSYVYTTLTREKSNNLEFNHLVNSLCFQYMKENDKE